MNDLSPRNSGRKNSATDYPALSIIVPVLNERAFIERCLRSLVPQVRPDQDEILVIDGGSTDNTCDIVRRLQSEYPSVSLVHNSKRLQAAAVNLGARVASPRSKIFVRADAHADYPTDFIELCATSLVEQGADSVVVPMHAKGETPFQRAVALAQNSRVGNGGSAHRRHGSASRFVDHGHHAAFDRQSFLSLGGYNEEFTHNEDAEYDHRLQSSGGRIWMCSEACITYFPRRSWRSLARQYFNHGQGRSRTLLLHRQFPKARQVLPPFILIGTIGGTLLSLFNPITLFIPGVYLGVLAGISVLYAIKGRDTALLAVGLASGTMHLSWGAGFLKALMKTFIRSNPKSRKSIQT